MFSAAAQKLIDRAEAFHEKLHAWYDAYHRLLPWRDSPSLYKTVVSEFMLQQTQVETVLPYFEKWIARWPDFASLAGAAEAEVVRAWEGLGYYNRARNLHALAKIVAALPEPPHTAAGWLKMPGVGPYTAAAISSIAFGAPAAVVDGNVVRVLSRLTANAHEFSDNGTAVKALTPLAQKLAHEKNPGDHNQAMMELGATICFRQKPVCAICPVLELCEAARQGVQEKLPRFAPRITEKVFLKRLWLVRDGKLLLRRHPSKSRRLADLCELPLLSRFVETPDDADVIATLRRAISNQQIEETIYRCRLPADIAERLAGDDEFIFVPLAELPEITLSGPHRKKISELLKKGFSSENPA